MEHGSVIVADENPVKAEILAYLQDDATRLGDVFRMRQASLTPAQMAEEIGVPTVGFAYSYGQQLDALIDAALPRRSAHVARQTAGRVRTLLKSQAWSSATRDYLLDLETQLESIANDDATRDREENEALERTDSVESRGTPGIYVYSLPHYLRYPFDAERGHTLFKVGRSDVDVFGRVGDQRRTTALPEDPLLLRVYQTDPGQSTEIERYFHTFLEDADHARSRASRGGREWFLTTTKFLDRLAKEKGLQIEVVNEELDPSTD
ncbi:MAG: GIY-YIG nuclease family protein [Propionibacteriaceae bacterium]|nr:GIY-YIG nuclease family protein [Propionibacteriaceae bacterium]